MDPCSFVRIVVNSLSMKLRETSRTGETLSSTSTTASFYCKIKLRNFPTQYSDVPVFSNQVDGKVHACFNLKKSELGKLPPGLKIEVYSGRGAGSGCGLGSGKFLGRVSVGFDLKEGFVTNGWVGVGKNAELYLDVRVESDPRFVFEFDGEPECSPQVFQVNGNVRQAVFTCKFGVRSAGERDLRSRSSLSEPGSAKSWINSLRGEKDKSSKERKGWSITIHDLSGSTVAMASMVTPFVPSKGTDVVSRANPGAWLILRPGNGTWKPWARLLAWRECKVSGDYLGYRYELLPDAISVGGIDPVTLSSSTISTKRGGKFLIDITTGASPMTTPNSSFDSGSGSSSESGSGSWAHMMYQGFVMSATLAGEGRCSKPEVEVGVQHVACTEDAAAFVALAAAMDLSMDACKLFSRKLRKELRQEGN